MNLHLSIFHSIDHHYFGKNLFSGGNCIITNLLLCCG
jgi:hypothetical protein